MWKLLENEINNTFTLTLSSLHYIFQIESFYNLQLFIFQTTLIPSQAAYNQMASTDLDTLLEMGFDKPRAELAMQKKGDCKSPFAAKVV